MSLHLPQQPYVLRVVIVGVASAILGACSPDIERFGATDRTPVGTTLIWPQTIAAGSDASAIPANRAAPVRAVTATPLQPVPASGPRAGVIPASRGGVSGARFAAPAAKSPAIAAGARNLAAASQFPAGTARNLTSHGRWSPKGGTAVTLAQDENLKTLERRYGVPAKTLMKVNGLTSAAQAKPGSRIVIPVYNRSGNVATASNNAPNARRKIAATARSRSAVIPPSRPSRLGKAAKPGNSKKLKRYRSAARAPVARARPERLKRAAARVASRNASARRAAEKARLKRQQLAKREAAARKAVLRKAVLRKARAERAKLARTKAAAKAAAARKTKSREAVRRIPIDKVKKTAVNRTGVARSPVGSIKAPPSGNFRWPARGRIIQGFKKGRNDGINIAVPEGAPIKAAEAGIVAYAGSELKGYGNLVLVRHTNGYVSAYAHNSQLKVKRGDRVRRGQTIARAGRTGNVSTPQLHFELRKDANPVNPVTLLGSN